MQKLANLDKWTRLSTKDSIRFSNTMPRTVRLQVNSPDVARLWVEPHTDEGSGELQFLARVVGLDVIEFSAPGAFSLFAEGEDVFIYTADGADVSLVNEAPESFTKIVERRRRNPELEYMMAIQNRNMEKRLAELAEEQFRRLERSQQARPQVDPATGVSGGPSPEPGQTAGHGSSDPQAAAAPPGTPRAADAGGAAGAGGGGEADGAGQQP